MDQDPAAPVGESMDNPLAGIADDDRLSDDPIIDNSDQSPADSGAPAIDDMDFMARIEKGVSASSDGADIDIGDYESPDGKDRDLVEALNGRASNHSSAAGVHGNLAGRKVAMRAGWGGLLILWLTVFSMVFVFGETLQSIWPASSQIYAALAGVSDAERFKAEADQLSAAITDAPEKVTVQLSRSEDDQAQWITQDGINYLVLTVIVKNDGTRAATVPQVRITFLDRQNQPLGNWIEDPPGRVLRRGSFLRFRVERPDYPVGVYRIVTSAVDGSASEGEAPIP